MRFDGKPAKCILAISLFSVCALPISAHAAVIGSEQYFDAIDRRESLDRIEAVLARAEVASELHRLGVDRQTAVARADALSDRELQLLADDLEELPAGGSLLGTIGLVAIIVLILELAGVIDIFKKV